MKVLAVCFLATVVSLMSTVPVHAALLVPSSSSKAVVSVDYTLVSEGEANYRIGPGEDGKITDSWKIKRHATTSATLSADKPTPLPGLHPMEQGQAAAIQQDQERGQRASKELMPMAMDIEKIVAKCGGEDNMDEACVEREVKSYGSGMKVTPGMKSAQQDVAAMGKVGPPRYQMWSPIAQAGGSFSVEESKISKRKLYTAGGIVACRTQTDVNGSGQYPALMKVAKNEPRLSAAAIEVDSQAQTMMLVVPVPFSLAELPITRKTTTNCGNSSVTQSERFEGFGEYKVTPLRVTLKGGQLAQEGTQTVNVKLPREADGTLTIRWSVKPL